MSDKVFIEGLEIETLIGIYDWERRIRQTLVFDIEMAFDNRIPAASDDIALTLNYKDVSKRLIDYVGQSGFGLVETLAERCAEISSIVDFTSRVSASARASRCSSCSIWRSPVTVGPSAPEGNSGFWRLRTSKCPA